MTTMSKLSPRQQEIMMLILENKSQKEAANGLGISRRTVECHLRRAREVTGCKSTLDLAVRIAIEESNNV